MRSFGMVVTVLVLSLYCAVSGASEQCGYKFTLGRFIDSERKIDRILNAVMVNADHYRLHPALLLSVMHAESSFRPTVVSGVGALGLMQVMPAWLEEIGQPWHCQANNWIRPRFVVRCGEQSHDLTNIETNIAYGAYILYYKAARWGRSARDLHNGLGAYNGTRGQAKYPRRVEELYIDHWQTAAICEHNYKTKYDR